MSWINKMESLKLINKKSNFTNRCNTAHFWNFKNHYFNTIFFCLYHFWYINEFIIWDKGQSKTIFFVFSVVKSFVYSLIELKSNFYSFHSFKWHIHFWFNSSKCFTNINLYMLIYQKLKIFKHNLNSHSKLSQAP